jgi:hypothetical protein
LLFEIGRDQGWSDHGCVLTGPGDRGTTVILPNAGWQASRKFGFREAGLDTAAVAGEKPEAAVVVAGDDPTEDWQKN